MEQQLLLLTQPKRYQHIYDNHELNINKMQVSKVSQVSHLSQVSCVSSNTPRKNQTNVNNYSTLQHQQSHRNISPFPERRSSISPQNHFNINKYTSQHPHPISHHQNFHASRSPVMPKSPVNPKSPANRTESKIRFNHGN